MSKLPRIEIISEPKKVKYEDLKKKMDEIVGLAYYGDRELLPFCEHRKEWLRNQLEELCLMFKT